MSGPLQKSSSEILDELFSTFDATAPTSSSSSSSKKKKKKKDKKSSSGGKRKHDASDDSPPSDVEKRLKKSRSSGSELLPDHKKSKKKKLKDGSSSSSTSKLLKSLKSPTKKSSSSSADKKDKKKRKKKEAPSTPAHPPKVEVEDGEIVEERHKAVKVSGMSASQAFKLDAEEMLLLGYKNGGGGEDSTGSSRSRSHSKSGKGQSSSSSSHTHKSRSPPPPPRHRSGSPNNPRLAPPRDSYKSSYMKFKKSEYEDYSNSSSGSSNSRSYSSSSDRYYDTEKYYDYHSKRSRTDYSQSKCGFGYVSKSYYYDDVEESARDRQEPSSSRDSRDSRDSSRDYHRGDQYSSSRDYSRDSRYDSGSSSSRDSRYGTSSWRHRHRSRSPTGSRRRSYYHPDDIIDKSELLEIARKNAKKLMQRGVMPTDIFSRDQILALKAGGKSVEELTSYCKKLAIRDAAGDARDAGSSSDSDDDGRGSRSVHHPFQVKDRPLPTITLNIRNSVPLPVRTPQELAIESAKLRTQFPVSSGTQHRFKEIEWKPVQPDEDKKKDPNAMALVPLDAAASSGSTTGAGESSTDNQDAMKAIEGVKQDEENEDDDDEEDTGITVDGPALPAVDISSVIGLRLKAMRQLQENPTSDDAKKQLDEATKMMKDWADAKALEPKFLTPAELQSGPQAWAKRDQLRKTRALDSGMGMHLLQKMGWKPGEGLGKNKEGTLEPLALDVKVDKKGLTAAVEEIMYGKRGGGGISGGNNGPSMPLVYDLSGKHPVSALMELTAKRRWGAPEFEMCFEHGPSHKKQFVYKVIVNGVEYQPCVAVGNKKQAKANAAAFCLQSLGLLPTGAGISGEPTELLQTVSDACAPISTGPEPSSPMTKFSGGSMLQTVSPIGPVQPPLPKPTTDASILMPPPPPPPPLLLQK